MYKTERHEHYGATALLLVRLNNPSLALLHSLRPSRAACVQSEVWVGILAKRWESSEYGVKDLEVVGLTVGSVQVRFTTCGLKVVIIS